MTDINKTIQNFYDFMDEHKDLNFLNNKTKTMVKILEDKDQNAKVLYCSSTMMPIGCIMHYTDDVEHFLQWLEKDAKLYEKGELIDLYYKWKNDYEDGKFD